jgi:hypothetical protein
MSSESRDSALPRTVTILSAGQHFRLQQGKPTIQRPNIGHMPLP